MRKLIVDNDKLRSLLWQRQGEIARLAKLHPDTVKRKLNGKNEWKIKDLNELAEKGGFDVSEIVEIR